MCTRLVLLLARQRRRALIGRRQVSEVRGPEAATEAATPSPAWQDGDDAGSAAGDEAVEEVDAQEGAEAPRPSRFPRYLPLAVFVVTTVALMPKALAGQATYAAVDLLEGTSPYRDAIGRLPSIKSPIQTDQAEYFPALVRFWEQARHGAYQLWEPRFGAGNPLGTLPLMSLLSPLSLALLVTPAWYGVTLRAAGLLLVSQGFMYLFLRRLGVSRAVGTLAAVAYTFSGSSLIFVHRMNAVFLLPAMLWAAHRLVTRPGLRTAAVVAAFTAWAWFEGFPAAFLFNVYTAGALVVWLVWRSAARRHGDLSTGWGGRAALAQAGRQVGWYAVGSLWGLALSMINLLPFVTYVQANDLLENRTFDSANHLPAVQLFGLFDLSVIGPVRDGPWWTGGNPVESITHAGMLVMGVVIAGLVAAAIGRLRLTPQGRDVWPFFAFAALVMLVLTFIGTGFLGLAYRLPTLQDNLLFRGRYVLVLSLVVLAALATDAWLRRRADDRERAPQRSTVVVALVMFALAMTALDDLTRVAWIANQGKEVLGSVLRGALLAAVGVGAMFLARRRPRLIVPATLVTAAVLWIQLAWPLRSFTPQAPKDDFYTVQAGHETLRELAGDQYRFAAAGFEVYPNSAQLFDAYELRGLALRSEELKALVRAANPTAFDRDPLKILLTPEEWNLTSPVYDELGMRYFALGTSTTPYGRDVPRGRGVDGVGAAAAGCLVGGHLAGGPQRHPDPARGARGRLREHVADGHPVAGRPGARPFVTAGLRRAGQLAGLRADRPGPRHLRACDARRHRRRARLCHGHRPRRRG